MLAGSRWWAYGVGFRTPSLHVEMIGVILRSIPMSSFSLKKIHVVPCEYRKSLSTHGEPHEFF